jgi:hypothetical protein
LSARLFLFEFVFQDSLSRSIQEHVSSFTVPPFAGLANPGSLDLLAGLQIQPARRAQNRVGLDGSLTLGATGPLMLFDTCFFKEICHPPIFVVFLVAFRVDRQRLMAFGAQERLSLQFILGVEALAAFTGDFDGHRLEVPALKAACGFSRTVIVSCRLPKLNSRMMVPPVRSAILQNC